MHINRVPQLPEPPKFTWEEIVRRVLTGMSFFHTLLRWVSGSLILAILIVVCAVVLYVVWRGGGEIVEWVDSVCSE